jgi:hypothetical protein
VYGPPWREPITRQEGPPRDASVAWLGADGSGFSGS